MTKECNRQRYREAVFQSFAALGHERDKCVELAEKFENLTNSGMSGEGAAGIILSAYAAVDARQMKTIKDWVESELEVFNATHQGIDTNPATRLKKAIKTFNENIDKCCILVNNVPLSAKEIQKIKAVVPSCLSGPTIYQTTATDHSGKTSKLVLEVTI
jgi:hypothetical protein